MEIALTPLDFARRTRRLYADREAVVDGAQRFSYRQLFERCDRFSSALLKLGGADVVKDGRSMGEIVVRGNVVMQGYYKDPEASANAIRDGWFHTGDAAVVHADGYLEIRQFARQHLAGFKVPQGISFLSELPKTATGKIQKYALRGGAAIARQ